MQSFLHGKPATSSTVPDLCYRIKVIQTNRFEKQKRKIDVDVNRYSDRYKGHTLEQF